MRVGLYFDLRNPDRWHKPWKDSYRAVLDLIVEAERLGLDIVKIAEHHQFEDGYSPQPLTFLAALATRTERIRIATGILTLPLHNPIDVAEQAAVVDCLSGGRLELGLGAGYRAAEYALFGLDIADRYRLYERKIGELKRAWERVTPHPVQDAIPLWAGVVGPKANRLAGRLGMGRLALSQDTWPDYLAGLEEGGHGVQSAKLGGYLQGFLADDPGRTAARLEAQLEYNWNSYTRHYAEDKNGLVPRPFRLDDCLHAGFERVRFAVGVMSIDDAVERIREMANGRKIHTICFPGTISGVVDDVAYRSLELIATKLKPLLAPSTP